jgi:hypothetical protein
MSRGIHGRRHLIMQLGRTVIGAIIGAAIGIAIMVAAYLALSFDKVWLALPVAILTGLGVRMMVATGGHASYLRGAVTCALALAAYLVGWNVVATLAQQNAAKAAESTRAEAADAGDKSSADAEKADGGATADETKPADPDKVEPAEVRPRQASTRMKKTAAPTSLSPLDFIVLCVSALIAYELGRGTAPKAVAVADDETPPRDVPQGTHPDA